MLLLMDENVPASVGRVFEARGHTVEWAVDVTLPRTPDEIIARYGDVHGAIVVTWNARDFKHLSPAIPQDNVIRFRRLSWIVFRCNEARGAERAERWLPAIEQHVTLARFRRDPRLMISITLTTFTVLG